MQTIKHNVPVSDYLHCYNMNHTVLFKVKITDKLGNLDEIKFNVTVIFVYHKLYL